MSNGSPEQFDEDLTSPIRDLSQSSPRSPHDARFSYCMADIDTLSLELGIPWEKDKDIPFGTIVPFIGFSWDITSRLVSLPPSKKAKYLAAITEWNLSPTHNLAQTQKLYGKLLHTCHIIPKGKQSSRPHPAPSV